MTCTGSSGGRFSIARYFVNWSAASTRIARIAIVMPAAA